MMYFCGPSSPGPADIARPEASWVTMKRTTRTAATRALGRLDQARDEEEALGRAFGTSIWKLSPRSM